MHSIKVVNRSEWPTWIVRWMVRKACADAGVTEYHWTQKQLAAHRFWYGRGGRRDGWGGVSRKCLTAKSAWWQERDSRFVDGHGGFWIPHTPVACLAFLIRHEVEHAGDGHPSRFRKGGRVDRYTMEYVCNGSAAEWVKALNEEWPTVFREWLRLARAERARCRRPGPAEKAAGRLEERRGLLSDWERKLKLAQTKVRKYRRAVVTMERRAATHPTQRTREAEAV